MIAIDEIQTFASSIKIIEKEFDAIYWVRDMCGKDFFIYFKNNKHVKTGTIDGFNDVLLFAKKLVNTTFIFKISFEYCYSDKISIHVYGNIANFKNDLISCLEENHVVGDCNIYENFVINKVNEYIGHVETLIIITKTKSLIWKT